MPLECRQQPLSVACRATIRILRAARAGYAMSGYSGMVVNCRRGCKNDAAFVQVPTDFGLDLTRFG